MRHRAPASWDGQRFRLFESGGRDGRGQRHHHARPVPEESLAGDIRAVPDGGGNFAESGQRDFGEGAAGDTAIDYAGRDQFA